jgi:toxin ParE1/3/4
MRSFDLTKKAEADLEGIIRYTTRNWGAQQAQKYLKTLEGACEMLASNPNLSINIKEVDKDLYMMHCEHHYLVCLRRKNKRPHIIAILHEKMDIPQHIRKRLQG